MNKPKTRFMGRKRIVVVSLFSGMDIVLLGMRKGIRNEPPNAKPLLSRNTSTGMRPYDRRRRYKV